MSDRLAKTETRYRYLASRKSAADADAKRLVRNYMVGLRKEIQNRLAGVQGGYTQWVGESLKRSITDILAQYDQRFQAEMRDQILSAAVRGAESATELFGSDLSQQGVMQMAFQGAVPKVASAVLRTSLQMRGELISGVTAPIKARIMTAINLGVAGVASPFETAKAIDSIIGSSVSGAVTRKAALIAHQETVVAYNTAQQLQTKQVENITGVEIRREWWNLRDNRVRPTHVEAGAHYMNGGRPGPIKLDERFKVGAASLRFPGDPLTPYLEEIMNCRCEAVPLRITANDVRRGYQVAA